MKYSVVVIAPYGLRNAAGDIRPERQAVVIDATTPGKSGGYNAATGTAYGIVWRGEITNNSVALEAQKKLGTAWIVAALAVPVVVPPIVVVEPVVPIIYDDPWPVVVEPDPWDTGGRLEVPVEWAFATAWGSDEVTSAWGDVSSSWTDTATSWTVTADGGAWGAISEWFGFEGADSDGLGW